MKGRTDKRLILDRWRLGIVFICLLSYSHSFAAENPYKDIDVDRAVSTVVKEFNRFDFLESIVSMPGGVLYTTNLFKGMIFQINKKGNVSKLVDIDGKLVGLAPLDSENLIATGSNSQNEAIVLQININTRKLSTIIPVPNALLLNGITQIDDSNFLIADSFKGVIWKLNIKNSTISTWLDHEMLASPSVENQVPGVNGIKVYNNAVYISNTGKMTLVKIPINKNGSAGKPEVLHANVFIDDFVIDETGNIYGATHIYDSIIKITSEGKITIIAQSDQGVSGSTCVTIVQATPSTLFVSTNGGFLKQDKSMVVPAKIVKLELK